MVYETLTQSKHMIRPMESVTAWATKFGNWGIIFHSVLSFYTDVYTAMGVAIYVNFIG